MSDQTQTAAQPPAADQTHPAAQAYFDDLVLKLFQGAKPAQLRKRLVKDGLSEADADATIARAQATLTHIKTTPEFKAARAASGFKNMWIGACWFIGGSVVTGITYASASSSGGGKYMIFWGAIIIGFAQMIWGLCVWQANKASKPPVG